MLMSEVIRNTFLIWMEAFESKGLIVNLGKIKVMVCVGIAKDDLSNSRVDPCVDCSLDVKTNLVCVYSVVSRSSVDVLE